MVVGVIRIFFRSQASESSLTLKSGKTVFKTTLSEVSGARHPPMLV